MMICSYTDEAIKNALQLLNRIEVRGIENCKRVTLIEEILQHPEINREDKDSGKHCEEKHPVTG